MRSRKLDPILRDLHEREPDMRPEHEQRLENELLSRHEQLYGRNEGWKMLFNPQMRAGRLVLVGVALVALGIAACAVPTEYEADVGKSIDVAIPAGSAKSPELHDLQMYLTEADIADEVSVSVSESSDGSAHLYLMLWGQNISTNELLDQMRERFPALEGAQIDVQDVSGTVRGSWAQKIGHDVFKFEVSGETEEEIREQFLAQLAAQGFEGDATIEVHDEGDERTIDITIEKDE
jgi:hypothetical protein